MSLSGIRTQIKTILEGVTNIGVVHEYERWAVDWSKILDLFKPERQAKVNGWMITRTSTEERTEVFGRNLVSHLFLIRGIYSLSDQDRSEIEFQTLIESIRDAFRSKFNLNQSCESTYYNIDSMTESGRVGIQVKIVEPRSFGGILCHYCELEIGAQERVTY